MPTIRSPDKQELPSSVGVGWLNISVDDPQRDERILSNNIMRELCQMPRGDEISVGDIPTIQAFDKGFIDKFLKFFSEDTNYIEILPNGNIRLSDTGRDHCSEYF